MTVLQSIFLGLLQGLTEFLPVSSSGHLILAQRIFGVQEDLFFDVALHVGTLFAVVIAFRKSLFQMIRHPKKDKKLLYVLLASVPTFAVAALVKFLLPTAFTEGLFLPIGFAATIVFLVVSHFCYKPTTRIGETKLLPVLVCGLVQGVAVFPGLSRSGSTVSTLKLFGVEQTDAAEFSFLLSVPVIVGGAAVEGIEAFGGALTTPWYCVAIGVVCAFVSGYVAISTVLRALKNNAWIAFAVYLIVPLAISLIIL